MDNNVEATKYITKNILSGESIQSDIYDENFVENVINTQATPLEYAVWLNNLDLVRYVYNIFAIKTEKALDIAMYNENLEIFKFLSTNTDIKIHQESSRDGGKYIDRAAYLGLSDFVEFILSIEIVTTEILDYPFKLAAKNGHLKIVKLIFSHLDKQNPGNPWYVDKFENENFDFKVVQYLQERNSNLTSQYKTNLKTESPNYIQNIGIDLTTYFIVCTFFMLFLYFLY